MGLGGLKVYPSPLWSHDILLLNFIQTLWQRQTKDFGHTRASEYSVLILDNRGVGESDKPMMRYSTSEMAKDVIEIIDELGWTAERELNILGISMGGMIAQEIVRLPPTLCSSTICFTCRRLVIRHPSIPADANSDNQAYSVPTRLNSLTLLSTAARLINSKPYTGSTYPALPHHPSPKSQHPSFALPY